MEYRRTPVYVYARKRARREDAHPMNWWEMQERMEQMERLERELDPYGGRSPSDPEVQRFLKQFGIENDA